MLYFFYMEQPSEDSDSRFIRTLQRFSPMVNAIDDRHSSLRRLGIIRTPQQTKDFIAQNAGRNLSKWFLIFAFLFTFAVFGFGMTLIAYLFTGSLKGSAELGIGSGFTFSLVFCYRFFLNSRQYQLPPSETTAQDAEHP